MPQVMHRISPAHDTTGGVLVLDAPLRVRLLPVSLPVDAVCSEKSVRTYAIEHLGEAESNGMV